ncbi:hypothetical protein AWV80_20925 [Cupriavidus sp. UYMU48A]|nr:hypothetical protein AWV80_20925 [Cupriavidus sp. UYMU48A]
MEMPVSAATECTLQCVEPSAGLVCNVVWIKLHHPFVVDRTRRIRANIVVQTGYVARDEARAPLAHRGIAHLPAVWRSRY